jgi:hypothetical protein
MDYNLYYGNATAMIHWGTSGNLNSIPAVRSATGMEVNGQLANPLIVFATPDSSAAMIPANSLAIAAGMNLTNLGQTFLDSDKNGTARPGTGAWDAGAYSYGSIAVRPEPPGKVTGASH